MRITREQSGCNREESITSKGEGHDLLEVGSCRGRTVHDFALVNIFLCEILDGRVRLVPVFNDSWGGRDSTLASVVILMVDWMTGAINLPFPLVGVF